MAAVADELPQASRTEFFVVGSRKFLLLSLSTMGLYQYFWFYMQWARYRRFHNDDMWPVARSLFSVFFTHRLAGEIDHRLQRGGVGYRWSPGWVATGIVVLTIASTITGRLPYGLSLAIDLAPFALLVPITWLQLQIQRAANAACGDPEGEANRHLTWANWAWLVVGALMWLVIAAMLALLINAGGAIDVTLPQR